MPDPTIPRHARQRGRSTTSGWFVDYGDTVLLRDRWGNTWSLDSVSIASGTFGFADDGFEKLPRPWKYDGDKVVVRGDVVIIDFADGNPKTPIARGGIRQATKDDFLARNHADTPGAPYNRCRARLRALDAAGVVQGEVRLNVHEGTGDARLSATDTIEIFVGSDLDGTDGIWLVVAGGGVRVGSSAGTAAEGVILGKTFLTDLSTWQGAVTTFLTALGADATNPAVQAAAVALQPAHASFAGQVSTAVGAAGAPYLSEKLTTE